MSVIDVQPGAIRKARAAIRAAAAIGGHHVIAVPDATPTLQDVETIDWMARGVRPGALAHWRSEVDALLDKAARIAADERLPEDFRERWVRDELDRTETLIAKGPTRHWRPLP